MTSAYLFLQKSLHPTPQLQHRFVWVPSSLVPKDAVEGRDIWFGLAFKMQSFTVKTALGLTHQTTCWRKSNCFKATD